MLMLSRLKIGRLPIRARAQIHTSCCASQKPTQDSSKVRPDTNKEQERQQNPPQSVTDRDQEVRERLMNREGGNSGVGIVDGKFEGGLGKETKKNMFRLI